MIRLKYNDVTTPSSCYLAIGIGHVHASDINSTIAIISTQYGLGVVQTAIEEYQVRTGGIANERDVVQIACGDGTWA
jgi:hypothetical protein